jgi:hypothetical protein
MNLMPRALVYQEAMGEGYSLIREEKEAIRVHRVRKT